MLPLARVYGCVCVCVDVCVVLKAVCVRICLDSMGLQTWYICVGISEP